MSRPLATEKLHVRIPPAEKQALREEARRHGISMSGLIRISVISARQARKRAEVMQIAYPQGKD
jgi:Mobilization protein NikA